MLVREEDYLCLSWGAAASRDRGAGNENSAYAGSSGFRAGVRPDLQDRQSNYTYEGKKGQRHLFIAHFIQKVQRGVGPGPSALPRIAPAVQATRYARATLTLTLHVLASCVLSASAVCNRLQCFFFFFMLNACC